MYWILYKGESSYVVFMSLRYFLKINYSMSLIKINSHFRQLWTCVWPVTHTSTGVQVWRTFVPNTFTCLSTNRAGREKRSTNLAVRTSYSNLEYPSSLSTFSFSSPPASSSMCAGRRGKTKLRSFEWGVTFTKPSSNYFSHV